VLYFNVDHICDMILARTHGEAVAPKLVVLDLSNAAYVDLQGAHSLAHLARELKASGIRLQAVEAHAAVRDRFRNEGLDADLGGLNRHATVAEVVQAFLTPSQESKN
jgi:MFS superfamily sulfate permease-like transporter